ncbi:MAG TPA: DUF2505 domain-containing protein [Pseudonocardia sp.]|nr:DUF2505 domain-containing protein [Pseudonocardia sp.]
MARSIDYSSMSRYPADEVYATMVDPDFLRARLDELGGPGARLVEHSADVDGARYRLRHGLDNAVLPPMVQKLVAGDLVIERTETLRRHTIGRYGGDVGVQILGTPVTASGVIRLADLDDAGSEMVIRADVTVRVPLIGGRIEEVIAENVRLLLAAETEFTMRWLDGR